ncbi:MAG: hypothetical protein PUP46_09005, partial [Endozoicomonas sp. (ex Botrylloides leachii)]|nr:hypothetical protein [Endozoicomonas sp. (ex Botrylloides leachii)]
YGNPESINTLFNNLKAFGIDKNDPEDKQWLKNWVIKPRDNGTTGLFLALASKHIKAIQVVINQLKAFDLLSDNTFRADLIKAFKSSGPITLSEEEQKQYDDIIESLLSG